MRSLLDILYPYRCLLCDASGGLLDGIAICQHCAVDIVENHLPCMHCGVPLKGVTEQSICGQCLSKPPSYQRLWSPFIYSQPLEWMIQQLKFNDKLAFGPVLSMLMMQKLFCWHDDTGWPEVIIPMPLHSARLRQRGFNQSELLIRPVAEALNIKIDSTCCQRVRNTQHQTGKNARQRKQNIKGAFRFQNKQAYRHVVIFDDVVTTTSSVSELTKTLLSGQVERVDVWCLARAEKY